MNDIFVAGYWGARQEGPEECAKRLERSLEALALCSTSFGAWYEKGNSRKDAETKQVYPFMDSVIELLERGTQRREVNGSIIHELGFQVGLWNGMPDWGSASFSVICGQFANSPLLRNSFLLNPPKNFEGIRDKTTMSRLLKELVECWSPDWGVVCSRTSRRARNLSVAEPFVDWISYLKTSKVDIAGLPLAASVIKVGVDGYIVVTQDHPIDAHNAADLNGLAAVSSALGLKTQ